MPLNPAINDAEREKELSAKLNVLASEQQERLAQYRAEQLGLPYVSLVLFPVDSDTLELIPKTQAEAAGAVFFYKHGKDIRLGVINPKLPQVAGIISHIKEQFGVEPQLYVISHKSLQTTLRRYRREQTQEAAPEDEMRVTQEEATGFTKSLKSLAELGVRITSLPPTEILQAIVAGAALQGASDIHIEPKEKEARLRFRVDGVLQDITAFDREGWALLLSRVKILAKLKLNIKNIPQDGSFVLRIGQETYDMRVSILPGGYGENIVIRLLDRKSEAVGLPELGMKERDLAVVKEQLKATNGMILVTGPTGSGKTTTLASFLREVNKAESKIITLEDPIEYRIPGIEQTEVDHVAGYTFAVGLRSILRQDPDIIMIGEMRDAETAETAIHAALTGHLVFSTLHTNDAAGAVPRLVDMGLNTFVLAPALNMIIAQRLVRRVCMDCAEKYKPDAKIRERIMDAMRGVRSDVFNPAILKDPKLEFYRAKGCSACGETGYKGRIGLYEIFTVEGRMEELILQGADRLTIQNEALTQGMTTIAQDGFLKVIEGITTIEEVERISEE